jgi:hypothetical protein
MSIPYLHKCAKCGESWWDAHVCAQDLKIKPSMDSILSKALLNSGKKIEPAAQPDCRTCRSFINDMAGIRCGKYPFKTSLHCTNGDQYQEATKVVLWRTE